MSTPPAEFCMRSVAVSGDTVRLYVSGELDIATAPALRSAVTRELEDRRDVLLDLGELEFLDSMGIGALIESITEAKLAGRRLEICGPFAPNVHRVLELTGVLAVLPLVDG